MIEIIYTKFTYSESLSNVVIMFLEITLGEGNWLFICPPLGTEQLSSYAFGINRWKGVSIFPSILLIWLLHDPSIILLRFLTNSRKTIMDMPQINFEKMQTYIC